MNLLAVILQHDFLTTNPASDKQDYRSLKSLGCGTFLPLHENSLHETRLSPAGNS